MSIFRRIIFCLLFIFFGCSKPVELNTNGNVLTNAYNQPVIWNHFPVLITIDSSLLLREKNFIVDSINTWNATAQTEIFTYEFRTTPNPYDNAVWIRTCQLEVTESGNQILGRINRRFVLDLSGQPVALSGADICILENLEQSYWNTVTLHELGHALSLNHDLERNSIMYLHAPHSEQIIANEDITFVRTLTSL